MSPLYHSQTFSAIAPDSLKTRSRIRALISSASPISSSMRLAIETSRRPTQSALIEPKRIALVGDEQMNAIHILQLEPMPLDDDIRAKLEFADFTVGHRINLVDFADGLAPFVNRPPFADHLAQALRRHEIECQGMLTSPSDETYSSLPQNFRGLPKKLTAP